MAGSALESERVIIDKIGTGGVGLARAASGQVLMVPGVLPGEEVLVHVRHRRKDYLEGELVEILSGHPGRVSPRCPHFGSCGGCDLQQVDYTLQVEIKQAILLDQLQRVGFRSLKSAGILAQPLAAPQPFGYRQRLRLQVDEGGRWGFFRRRSHELEVIGDCLLARPEISTVLRKFSTCPALLQLLRHSREIEIVASPADRTIILLLTLRRPPRPADRLAAVKAAAELPAVKAIFLEAEGGVRLGPFPATSLEGDEDTGLVRFAFPACPAARRPAYAMSHEAGGFSQVNAEQNQQLLNAVFEWLATKNIRRAADLFCGMGNFAIPLALAGFDVFGADLQRSAIRSAKRNAAAAGLTNFIFLQASAEQAVRRLAMDGDSFDLVILDPPRRGCPEVVPLLPDLDAPFLLYISCDPATLARDLVRLLENGYRLEKIRMIDMFPQTAHLETMVMLQRETAG